MELIYMVMTIAGLIFGFYSGYKIGKEQSLPKAPQEIIHPIQTIKNNKDNKQEEKNLKILQKDLEEIDNFGG